MSPLDTASLAISLPPFSLVFVLRPLPTNFVELSTVKVMSLPAEVTTREVPLTDLTVPLAVIDFAFFAACACSVTAGAASARLCGLAGTPRAIARLPVMRIEKLIYPVSLYRHKARHVKTTCQILVERYHGRVPGTMEELLTLPGVGRKTANLVLILSFKSLKNICVDTHVHRISNRLGWVRTRTPEETEHALYRATDERWWPYINLYLVTWGQNVCKPVYPRCGACVISPHCARIGVERVSKT